MWFDITQLSVVQIYDAQFSSSGFMSTKLPSHGLYPQVRRAVEKVVTEMNRTDGIYFEQRVAGKKYDWLVIWNMNFIFP